MIKSKFVAIGRLIPQHSPDLIDYFEESCSGYSQAFRQVFHILKNLKASGVQVNISEFNTYLQQKFDITKRSANTIIYEARGRLNSLTELKKHELKQKELRIRYLEETVIPKLELKKQENITKINEGNLSILNQHRNLRLKLVAVKNRLNKLKQRADNLQYQLETGKLKVCFGTKRLLQRDLVAFRRQRDSQMVYIGSKEETACNQMFQLTYNSRNRQFDAKIRKDFNGNKALKGDDRYVKGQVRYYTYSKEIREILRNKSSPLTHTLIRKDNGIFVHTCFEISVSKNESKTCRDNGVIGVDFNKGFLSVSQTNCYGDLVKTETLFFRYKQGNKTEADLQNLSGYLIKTALASGKDIVIEDLSFIDKKTQAVRGGNKKYNEMLHSLAYSTFTDIIERKALKNQVGLIKVNPAWTSYLARKHYCDSMKLNEHIGAAFVIARRAQKYKIS